MPTMRDKSLLDALLDPSESASDQKPWTDGADVPGAHLRITENL